MNSPLNNVVSSASNWLSRFRRGARSPEQAAVDNNSQSTDGSPTAHQIRCAEIWGGIQNANLEACTSGIRASLFSNSCEGGRGGDVYYFSVCGRNVLTRVALADVTGHGERVSRVSQWLYDSLAARMNSRRGHNVLTDLNRAAERFGEQAISTAAVVGFYRWTGRLYFSYAGHPPIMLYRHRERIWAPLELPESEGLANLPVGIADSARFDQGRMRIRRGDRLVMYTDGIVEAPNRAGQLFGVERLTEVLNQAANAPLSTLRDAVLAAVGEHVNGPLIHDDVTLLAIEIAR